MYTIVVFEKGKVFGDHYGEFESPDNARKALISKGWSFFNRGKIKNENNFYKNWDFELEINDTKYFAKVILFNKPKSLNELTSKA